jgi:hypothetical protein
MFFVYKYISRKDFFLFSKFDVVIKSHFDSGFMFFMLFNTQKEIKFRAKQTIYL